MPNPKFAKLLENRKKGKKGLQMTIERRRGLPEDLVPISSVPLSPSPRRALDWIKKVQFDSVSRKEMQAIVDKELKKGPKDTAKKDAFPSHCATFKVEKASRKPFRALYQPFSRVRGSEKASKDRGEKPSALKPYEIHEKDGWFCCGSCSAATINSRQFAEHKEPSKHKLKISLADFPDLTEFLCGKIFKRTNQIPKYHHVKSCEIGSKLLK